MSERIAADLAVVGVVRSEITTKATAPKQGSEGAPAARIELDPAFEPAMRELRVGDKLVLVTWLHLADRDVLRVHPRGDATVPERGVFATRSPDRPNPLGLHPVELLAIDGLNLTVAPLEALDGTPIVDIKPLLGPLPKDRRDPEWAAVWQTLQRAGRRAWQRGLVAGGSGNMSLRQGSRVFVTASGCSLGELECAELAELALPGGEQLRGPAPSTESGAHLAVYAARPEAAAIVHVHPSHLLALDLLCASDEDFLAALNVGLYEAEHLLGSLAMAPALTPGTPELAQAVGRAAEGASCVYMRRHGLLAAAETPDAALAACEALEQLARVAWLARCGAGGGCA